MTCGCSVVHRKDAVYCERCGYKLSEPFKVKEHLSKTELLNKLSKAFRGEIILSESNVLELNQLLIWYNGNNCPMLRMDNGLSLGFGCYQGYTAIVMLKAE